MCGGFNIPMDWLDVLQVKFDFVNDVWAFEFADITNLPPSVDGWWTSGGVWQDGDVDSSNIMIIFDRGKVNIMCNP